MELSVIIHGRFHYFDVAKSLQKRGKLGFVISTYPKFFAKKYGINNRYFGLAVLEIYKRVCHFFVKRGTILDWFGKDVFGLYTWFLIKYFIPDAPHPHCYVLIFAGNSSSFLYTKLLKSKGYKIIVEDGSIHPRDRNKILRNNTFTSNLTLTPEFRCAMIENEYLTADVIMGPSQFVARSIESHIYPVSDKKVFVNPFGVDTELFSPETDPRKIALILNELSLDEQTTKICFCGSLTYQKGIYTLIEASKILAHEYPSSYEFVLIGDGDTSFINYLNTLQGVVATGAMKQHDLYGYFSVCDMFVMPSLQDGLALVQVQALACGLPLVCSTNSGGTALKPFIQEETDIYEFTAGNVQDLVSKIIKCSQHKKIGQKRTLLKSNSEASWEAYCERLERHLE